jgi:hypothetical protein
MRKRILVALTTAASLAVPTADATISSILDCTGANACTVTTTPPNPITPDPNDGVLLGWNEVQNLTLTAPLRVDRVFDPSAPFISDAGGGDYFIAAGTVVASHYFQWDPGLGSSNTVGATLVLDSQVFALITSDSNLFASDEFLGLAGLDYADFTARGLEAGDVADFNGPNVDISWTATSPGDWTRLITAFSPGGGDTGSSVPEPGTLALFGLGLAGLGLSRRRLAA